MLGFDSRSRSRTRRAARRAIGSAVGLALVCGNVPQALGITVTWTGSGGTSWTNSSWSNAAVGPGTGDTALFNDALGSSSFAGDVTSVLNANRAIGGLAFTNTSGKYHTLDLNLKTLTVAGNLNFNTDFSGPTTSTIRNGGLVVNGSFSTVNVGRSSTGTARSILDLTGLTSLSATVQDFTVGYSTSGAATGTVSLSPTNSITAQRIFVGVTNNGGGSTGTMNLGAANTLLTTQLNIGQNLSDGTVAALAGSTVTIGSLAQRTNLTIAYSTIGTNNNYIGRLDLTGSNMTAYLGDIIVGQKESGGFGGETGTFIGGTGGSVDIGAAGNTANIYVARKVNGTGDDDATGTIDFSNLNSVTANVNQFAIGTATIGPAMGTVRLGLTNNINANAITVGSNGTSSNLLALGKNNTVLTPTLIVGQFESSANITIPAAASSLTLGSTSQRTSVSVAYSNALTNGNWTSKIDLTGAVFNGFLSDLTVGQKEGGGFGKMTGTFIGGSSGTLDIGAAGNTANIYIGRKVNGTGDDSAVGTVDFSNMTTLNANVNNLGVGVSTNGSATGSLKLALTNNINATAITVGSGAGTSNTLVLGRTNTILAGSITVGESVASGAITIPAGTSSLSLGSATARTTLRLGVSAAGTNNSYTGTLDLTGAAFTGFLADVTVGQKEGGGFGNQTGVLVGGGSGTVDIGVAGNISNFYVGRKLTGGNDDAAFGTVNFSGLSTLTAQLNSFTIGTALTGSARGNVTLANTNTINATNVLIGIGGVNSNTLALGRVNTIQTGQFTIGQDLANAAVTIPVGGSLALGTPAARTSLSIAVGSVGDNNGWSGSLDLTGATFTAYLDAVTICSNSSTSGSKAGTLTISNRSDNLISANTVQLATGSTTTGTLNFGGGQFFAGTLSKGNGNATFNWTGGTLSVTTFGTQTTPWNLANSGTGTLSPGTLSSAISTTTVYGNYTQGAAASQTIEIAGSTAAASNDLLAVNGTATIAGTLRVNLINGFVPTVGQNFIIGTHTTRTGTYDFIAPPVLPAGVAFQIDYTTPTQVVLRTVAPTSQTWTGTAANATFGTSTNWSAVGVPTSTSALTINNPTAAAQTVTLSASTTVHRITLQGASVTATENLEVPAGIRLGVANQIFVGANARLTGGGQIFGTVVLADLGMLAPGAGVAAFSVGGNLQASSGSSIQLDLASPTSYDTVSVSGAATLAGTLNVSTIGVYSPAAGDTFQVLQFGSATGQFSSYVLPTLSAGLIWDTSRVATTGQLLATTGGAWAASASGNWSNTTNWTNGVSPSGSGQFVSFASAITSPVTVTVDSNKTAGTLSFDTASTVTVAGPGTLTLDSASGARVAVARGSHVIAAPVQLNSPTTIDVSAGAAVSVTSTIAGGAAATLTKSGAGSAALSGANTFVGSISVVGGTLDASGGSIDSSSGAMSVTNSGSTLIARRVAPASLTVGTGATVQLTNVDSPANQAGRSAVGSWDNSGLVDVGKTGIVIGSASEATIRAQIIAGRGSAGGAGAWTGTTGITSSAAVTNPGNRAVGYVVAGAQITVAQSVLGDSNLDDVVNIDDLSVLAQNYNLASKNWQTGDFNYDGTVNIDDLSLLAQNYNLTATDSPLASADAAQFAADYAEVFSGQAVPEPATMGMLGLLAAGLLVRRRREKQ